jgi:hypothetical protein
VAVPVVVIAARFAGLAWFDRTECAGSGGDCGIGVLWGLAWATAALVVSVAAILVLEVALLVRRRRQRHDT